MCNKKFIHIWRVLKTSLFTLIFLYELRQRGPHHVVCLRAPTILNPPLPIDQLYDEIWEVYREYAQQCLLFFITKLDSNHANHICIIMNCSNQYKHITVILNFLIISFQWGYCLRVLCHLCACTMLNVDNLVRIGLRSNFTSLVVISILFCSPKMYGSQSGSRLFILREPFSVYGSFGSRAPVFSYSLHINTWLNRIACF